jgi:hypothetical protein
MARALRFAMLAGVVTAAVLVPSQSHAQAASPAVEWGVHWGIQAVALPDVGGLVDNVPQRFRQLPSHPGDVWIYGSRRTMRTIPFDSIQPNPVSNLTSLHVAAALTVRRLQLRGGPAFAIVPRIDQGLVKGNTGATREVNQWGESYRGSGTSLVYYNMYPETSFMPGWLIESAITVNRRVSFFGGIGQDNFKLLAESGYDRFDRLEKYDLQKAGIVRVGNIHGGIDVQLAANRAHSAGLRLAVGQIRTPRPAYGMTAGSAGRLYLAAGLSVHHGFPTRN